MRTIAIHTSKGGVGKTTLTVNLAYEIARLGNRVLVIDLDEQGNSSLYLGVNEADRLDRAETLEAFNQILEGFRDRKEIIDLLSANFTSLSFDYTDYIYSSSFNKYLKEIENAKIDVIPSSYRTKEVGQLTARIGGTGTTEKLLNRVLKKIGNEYDYVLMDTSPNLTPVTKNALFAARHLIIPTQLEYFSAYSVSAIVREIQQGVQEEMEGLRSIILGIVPMMTEPLRGKVSSNRINIFGKELLQRAQLGTKLLPEIKRTKSFSTASAKRLPFRVLIEKKSGRGKGETEAVNQLSNLTLEIIERIDEDESKRGS